MSEFEQALYNILMALPAGKLCTYGELAKHCGYPNYARHVGKTLGKLPAGSKLPWHRVVNSQGRISLRGERFLKQKQRLEQEGITIDDSGKVLNFKDLRA